MPGSGHASYEEAHDPKYGQPFPVPLKLANEDSLRDFGHVVRDFDKEEVIIETWPSTGWRPTCPGTGRGGGIVSGAFKFKWEGDSLVAKNEAVGGDYVTGRLPQDVAPDDRTHVLVREANYHPDGGQVFYPLNNEMFVALLAPPGDDIKLEDFVAFYFDGSFGLQLKPCIWHQPMYPVQDEMVFQGKQGAVHGCVVMDTVDEFGRFLRVPLKDELVE